MKQLHYIGARPDVPENWTIYNAPRPLIGTATWNGDFLHGIFYAAIDPGDEFAAQNLETCRSLDAWEIVYWAYNDAVERIKQEYPQYADKVADCSVEQIHETFHNIMNERPVRVDDNNNDNSCRDCRYDSKHILCTHPDESKPGFWDEREPVEGRPWCWEKEECDEKTDRN